MRRLLACLAIACTALPASAQDVELELVLLADSSGSIDPGEIRFQRQGYAEAITDPRVVDLIEGTAYGRIAVTYVEWAAAGAEDVVVPWTIIDGPDTARAFAEALIPPPRRAFGRNAIGSALLTGVRLIEENEIEGWRKVIDFSGDSANNWNGPSIDTGRQAALEAGIVINGLAILCRVCSGPPQAGDLAQLYEERIIGGPGAFVVTAAGPDDFADAVRRKLILEIGGTTPPRRHATRQTPQTEGSGDKIAAAPHSASMHRNHHAPGRHPCPATSATPPPCSPPGSAFRSLPLSTQVSAPGSARRPPRAPCSSSWPSPRQSW